MEAKSKQTFIPKEFRPRVKGEKMFPRYNQKGRIDRADSASKFPQKISSVAVCLHVRDDDSVIKTIKRNYSGGDVVYLNYDDLGILWNFSYIKGELFFHTQNNTYKPIGIYNRPFFPSDSHPRFAIFNHLARVLEVWGGNLIGATSKNFHNASKPYQISSSIKEAIHRRGLSSISIPSTCIVNSSERLNEWGSVYGSIVKSCSGIRSHVAHYKTYKHWNFENLKTVPTQFQKAHSGPDIRVHWLRGKAWAVTVKSKIDSIDYRYAKERSPFEKIDVPKEVYEFCTAIAQIEGLSFLGADFIFDENKYICLECNPNPGWSGFHRAAGDEENIATTLIKELLNETNINILK